MRICESSLEFKEFLIGMEVGQEIEYRDYYFMRVLGGFLARYKTRFAICFIPYEIKSRKNVNEPVFNSPVDMPELEIIKSPKKKDKKKKK